MQTRAFAALTICAALWGGVFVAVHELLPVIGPARMVGTRFAMASVIFLVLMGVNPAWRPHFTRAEWVRVAIAGVLAVPATQVAVVEGQRYLAPPIASLIITSSPVVAAALGALFLHERVTRRNAIGFATALVGVALIVVLGAGTGADSQASDPLRASIILIGPTAWAIYTIVSKPLSDHNAIAVVGVALTIGSLVLVPILPSGFADVAQFDATAWLWMAYMIFGGTLAPYLLWAYGLKRLDVSRTVSFMYLIPVFATTWSTLYLGTTLSLITVGGGIVVLTGVILTQSTTLEPSRVP